MANYRIAPSILSANFAKLGEEVDQVIAAGADLIHFDVMDNHYVPNLSFGPMVCRALRDYGITAPIDVHLMVQPVDDLIENFINAGANRIAFHPEATGHIDRSLQLIKSADCEAGLALNPATPLSALNHVLESLDFVLVMSVNPGFGGQQFIPYTLDKIQQLKQLIDERHLNVSIAVDGGITVDNIQSVAKAGADTFIAGSAIFKSEDYRQTIAAMRAQLPE